MGLCANKNQTCSKPRKHPPGTNEPKLNSEFYRSLLPMSRSVTPLPALHNKPGRVGQMLEDAIGVALCVPVLRCSRFAAWALVEHPVPAYPSPERMGQDLQVPVILSSSICERQLFGLYRLGF